MYCFHRHLHLFRRGEDARLGVLMLHGALDVAVLAAVVEADGELQADHIAVVALAQGGGLVDVAVEEFGLVRNGVTGEELLGEEGTGDGATEAIGGGEHPCG